MPYAITLRLDAAASVQVTEMWRVLASRGASDEALRLRYPPHLTIAVVPDTRDRGRLIAVARAVAERWRALPLSLASLGIFPGSPATLFLAPVVTSDLLALHTEVLGALASEMIDPRYLRGDWVPHVTLASDLTDIAAALATLPIPGLPIDGALDAMEVVRFRPVEVLKSHRLRDA